MRGHLCRSQGHSGKTTHNGQIYLRARVATLFSRFGLHDQRYSRPRSHIVHVNLLYHRVLRGPEERYAHIEKVALALLMAVRRL